MASHTRSIPQRHAPPQQGYAAHPSSRAAAAAAVISAVAAPAGTFAPGTKIQVGSHRVVIQKYLSEGGFAHVYLVRLPAAVDGTDLAVLKRVAVPDKESLRGMRTEVETMKRLRGHRPIVAYMDSHASELRGGGYEVFLLMEYCDGGGLIDFMNTRLQHRLTEPEIVAIFADVAEGVACMHYLKPPLLHRDIKVENVLITTRSGGRRFMLCDFGSAAPPTPAPSSIVECRRMDEDVQKHTTLQYRSPEMIDVFRKQPLNEKADIWALGVFLYKLCYYTTPFEDQGQLAILNASYRFPSHPKFSDKLKRLIASMLRENLNERPNIYQVLAEACALQGRKIPIVDIYSGRLDARPPTKSRDAPKAVVGVSVLATPIQSKDELPDITPMRRGRPTPSPAPPQNPNETRKVIADGDPFAALDSKPSDGAKTVPVSDEISDRFPDLDQFSLLHHKGTAFDFDPKTPVATPPTRVADGLADSTLAAPKQAVPTSAHTGRLTPTEAAVSKLSTSVTSTSISLTTSTSQKVNARPMSIQQIPAWTASRYVSTGTMTSDSPFDSKPVSEKKPQAATQKSIGRSTSVRARPAVPAAPAISASATASKPQVRSRTPENTIFENVRGYSAYNTARPRPVSMNFDSRQEFMPDRTRIATQASRSPSRTVSPLKQDGGFIDGIPASNQSNLLPRSSEQPQKSPPSGEPNKLDRNPYLREKPKQTAQIRSPPIHEDSQMASIETNTEKRDDNEDLTPEMRRERERLQLEEEERRVAAAQSEYKQRLVGAAAQGKKPTPGPKPSSIQSRVQAYMGEGQGKQSVTRTAEGYGKYADEATAASRTKMPPPQIKRKPAVDSIGRSSGSMLPRALAQQTTTEASPVGSTPSPQTGVFSSSNSNKPTPKPPPKKPEYLSSIPTGSTVAERQPSQPLAKKETVSRPRDGAAERLASVARDQPDKSAASRWGANGEDDYLDDFSRRFPSLSAIEGGGTGR